MKPGQIGHKDAIKRINCDDINKDITTNYTVWCSGCINWCMSDGFNLTESKQYWKLSGWQFINKRWICPDCVSKMTKDALKQSMKEL